MTIYQSILDRVGDTPILSLDGLLPDGSARLFVKLEGANPGGSIKDRPALNMIERAEQAGLLVPGGTVVESTSGNLGVALAMACAIKGYRCVIVMDPRTNATNVAMVRALGAEIDIVTEMNPVDGTYQEARIARVKHLARTIPGAYMPWQYGNPWNAESHLETTAREIHDAFDGGPDVVVAAVSTAGQITGIGTGLRSLGARSKMVGIDVKGSVVFGGKKGKTSVTGMGLAWKPDNLDESVVDEAYLVETEPCFSTVRIVAKRFGVLLGGSSGASLFGAIHKALTMRADETVLAIASDRGEKYLDEFYDDAWMEERGLPINDDLDDIVAAARRLARFRRPSFEMRPAREPRTIAA